MSTELPQNPDAECSPHTKTKLNDVVRDTYRYQCPDCGSHTIVVRPSWCWWPNNYKEVRSGECEVPKRYRCAACQVPFDRPYDKKHGERRLPQSTDTSKAGDH